MHKKMGPLQAWQWAAVLAGLLLVYYEYEKSKANAAANAASTTGTSTDTTGAIDPTTGLPYASEIGSGAGMGGYGTSGGIGDTTGSLSSGSSLQQELSDLGAIEGLMSGLGMGQTVTAGGLSTGEINTLNGDLRKLNTTLGRQQSALTKLQQTVSRNAKKVAPPARKKTTKPGGTKNPGHRITTHPNGKKTVSSSAPHNAQQHRNIAPPSHQRATPTPKHKPTRAGGFR